MDTFSKVYPFWNSGTCCKDLETIYGSNNTITQHLTCIIHLSPLMIVKKLYGVFQFTVSKCAQPFNKIATSHGINMG